MIFLIRIGPLPESMAFLLLYIRFFATAYFATQVLIAVIVKYVIIFHGHLLEFVEDRVMVRISRICCIIWSLFVTCIQSALNNVSKSGDFLALTKSDHNDVNNDENPYVFIFILMLVNVLAVIFVQIRIEIYKVRDISDSLGVSGYTLRLFRKLGLVPETGLESKISFTGFSFFTIVFNF